MPIAHLPSRAVVEVSGEDRIAFLQGLVSNDVASPDAPRRAVWAALLTPQGKWLADFFVFHDLDRLLLDCEGTQAGMLVQQLSRFRLRSHVVLREAADLTVSVGWDGAEPPAGDLAVPDPRLPEAGWRVLASDERVRADADATAEDYDVHRLRLGLPDGSRDLESEKSVLLEAGFDELHGVSWTKGCYMGQELTARTKYRGLVKRRLVPVKVEGPLPSRGASVLRENVEVGEMRSGIARDDAAVGLALLRLDALEIGPLRCGDALLRPHLPTWMRLPVTLALGQG